VETEGGRQVASGPRVLGVIPARYSSTRLPVKPLVELCGKPMIRHVYERATRASLLAGVVVATDHEKVAEAVRSFGGRVMLTPAELRSGSDRVAFAVRELVDADIIVNIQGDEPLIEPQMIDDAVRPLLSESGIRVGTLVKKIVTAEELASPNVVKVVLDQEGYAIYFSRSPIPYLRNGTGIAHWLLSGGYWKHIGLYVFRRDFLLEFARWPVTPLERAEKLEQLRIIEHGVKIRATPTEFDSIPVDVPEDVERVQQRMLALATNGTSL
jgi:3-deoxy-manno-octulosonate cytidylyltransferase (CMP-KDO synthetase)